MTNRTFGECFQDVMCRPWAVDSAASPITERIERVTMVVHDPTCTRSAMMHGMVDTPCMVHLTITRKG